MKSIDTQCRCGAVKLQISGDPSAQFYCHCDDCQAVTGGAYVPIAVFPTDAVKVTAGKPVTWIYKTLPRSRCPACGTLLFGEPPGLGIRGVSGYLLPAGAFQAAFHIQCQHAPMPVRDALPHFKGFPAMFGGSDDKVDW